MYKRENKGENEKRLKDKNFIIIYLLLQEEMH